MKPTQKVRDPVVFPQVLEKKELQDCKGAILFLHVEMNLK
jgi:hypothetical protein